MPHTDDKEQSLIKPEYQLHSSIDNLVRVEVPRLERLVRSLQACTEMIQHLVSIISELEEEIRLTQKPKQK
jgi:hypothetical protein